jgi:hypothetical protein
MSNQSIKQCPNCKRWCTRQESFKHQDRHCGGTNCVETFNDIGSSADNPLLSNFTPGVETTVLQKSKLNQSYEDEYDDTEQKDDYVPSIFDSDSWVNNDEEFKEDMDDNTSFL